MRNQVGSGIKKMFMRSMKGDKRPTSDDLAMNLIEAFSKTTEVFERENAFLRGVKLEEVKQLLPEKTAALDALRRAYQAYSENGDYAQSVPAQVKAQSVRFDRVAEENTLLLEASLDAQKAVMKMLVDSAAQAGFSGYGPTGEVASDGVRSIITQRQDV